MEEGHELRSLCDVFTYTTMISQCGSHHQLRRALELVAEMRGRAIPLNVHTYSALLNVCLKANELDLALDIYAQMLAEGCAPNMVTYNTLVDIYGKIGKWADALGVLDLLQQQVGRDELWVGDGRGLGGCRCPGAGSYSVRSVLHVGVVYPRPWQCHGFAVLTTCCFCCIQPSVVLHKTQSTA